MVPPLTNIALITSSCPSGSCCCLVAAPDPLLLPQCDVQETIHFFQGEELRPGVHHNPQHCPVIGCRAAGRWWDIRHML
jgi:hypothetical protein